jgi:hypothetical protein
MRCNDALGRVLAAFATFNRLDHQQIVPARGGDFERALGALLALHIGEVEPGRARRREPRLGRRQQLGALEMIDDRQEARRRDHLHFARPGRLAAAFGRADDAAAAARRRQCREQHAADPRESGGPGATVAALQPLDSRFRGKDG